jgi:poly-beta-1,6-N-acetyl-D-glucosamine N-deacetylase
MTGHRTGRRVGPVRSALLTAATVAVAVAYMVIPSAVQLRSVADARHGRVADPPSVGRQVPPVVAALPAAPLAALRRLPVAEADAPPLILAYHDVSPSADPYTVSPAAFGTQMRLLDAAGYRTVTTAQVLDWMAGGARLPARSVLLTFDDGVDGIFRYADPVLAQHGFTASTYLITGAMRDRPGYHLSWDEARVLGASGRWTLEAHSHDAHRRIPIDRAGRTGPALTNRAWLPAAGRRETLEEYTARITADVAAQQADFSRHGLPAPRVFAYPFSAVDQPTDDPRIPAILRGVVRQSYAASFVNEYGAATSTPAGVAGGELRRIEITRSTTPAGFAAAAARGTALPRDPRVFADRTLWTADGDRPGAAPVRGRTTLPVPAGRYVRSVLAPGRTTWWTDYRVSARIGGLTGGADGALQALAGTPDQIQLGVSRGWATVRRGSGAGEKVVAQRGLSRAAGHRLAITVTADGKVRAEVDGQVLLDASYPRRAGSWAAGGIGVAASADRGGAATVVVDELRVQRLT